MIPFMPSPTPVPPVLTLPGLGGSDAGHWQTAWERLLPATRVEQADWDAPRYPAWAAVLSDAVRAAPRPPVLVAHSLGCILAARWLATALPGAVAGAFLVAPPDLDRILADPGFDIRGFDPVPVDPLPVPAILVASRDDEYLAIDRAELFARRWNAAFHDAGTLGHINAASALGDWPDGLARFRAFAAALGR